MKKLLPVIVLVSTLWSYKYAVVIKGTTYSSDSGWRAVADTLINRHNGRLFTWTSRVTDVQDSLSAYMPDYIAFVARPVIELNANFVRAVSTMTRELDDDPYGDAIWGIVTGFYADDALRAVTVDSLRVKSLLGGFIGYTGLVYQSITTSVSQHHRIVFTFPDREVIDTVASDLCPTDRTYMLAGYLNNGFNDSLPGHPRIEGPVDMFVTSGHANVDVWQLHYPDPDDEGYFRSRFPAQLYGEPHSGADTLINSTNPKVYYAPGNCLIANPNMYDNMVYAWFHTGGAIQMIGYIVVTWYGYMGWGVGSYFFQSQGDYTLQESFFANNQSLVYDLLHGTPGTDSSGLAYDRDAVVIYGDPAQPVRLYPVRSPLYSQSLTVREGSTRDTFEYRITVNYDSTALSRHPIGFLPYRIDSVQILETNAVDAVVTDNFVMLHCWHSGMPRLNAGEQRYVIFTGKRILTQVQETPEPVKIDFPSMVTGEYLTIKFGNVNQEPWQLSVYGLDGRKILNHRFLPYSGARFTLPWRLPAGVYFVRIYSNTTGVMKKVIVVR